MSTSLITHVFETSAQEGSARTVLIYLAWRADDDGASWPAMSTIAEAAKVDVRRARRLIAQLVAAGEVEVEVGAGPRGTNRYRVIAARGRQLKLIVTPGAPTPGPQTPRVEAPSNTPVPLVSITEEREVSPGPQTPRVVRPPLTPAAELRQVQSDAKSLWLKLRKRPGLERFTDKPALRWLADAVARSAETWADIERGLRKHAPNPKSNPSYADEWIREAAGDRREEENRHRKMAERDAEHARMRDEPADPAVLEQVKAASRAMRMRGAS